MKKVDKEGRICTTAYMPFSAQFFSPSALNLNKTDRISIRPSSNALLLVGFATNCEKKIVVNHPTLWYNPINSICNRFISKYIFLIVIFLKIEQVVRAIRMIIEGE